MAYFYRMYGLCFESDIKLYDSDALTVADGCFSDVTIKISSHFKEEVDALKENNLFFSNMRIMFRTDAGDFLVEDGRRIYVNPVMNASNSLLSAFIIGWCISYLMFQRNKTAIHCSALCYKEMAYFISGLSGAGKSTTAMNLIRRGHKYLSDDIAFVSSKDGFMVSHGLPIQKICRNVADTIEDRSNLLYVDEMKDKFAIIDTDNICRSEKKLSVGFMLEIADTPKVEYEPVEGFSKVAKLIDSLFMYSSFNKTGFPTSVKSECLKLAGNMKMINIKRPSKLDSVDEICDIIERYLEEICPQ